MAHQNPIYIIVSALCNRLINQVKYYNDDGIQYRRQLGIYETIVHLLNNVGFKIEIGKCYSYDHTYE